MQSSADWSMLKPMNPIIEVRDLVKHYKKVKAVDDISFAVAEKTCFGLLGPNGAGKTTTIEIMESIHDPDSGTVLFRGQKTGHSFKEKIGIQFQYTALQEFLTVRETLKLFAGLYPKHRSLDEIIEVCSLKEFIDRDNRTLSGGERQRMLLGIALINDPDLLFLDEPTTGLDPQARRNFWRLIQNIRDEGKTVILTTHYMDEAEYLCDQVVIMNHGKIIEQGEPEDLLRKHFGEAVIQLPEKSLPQQANLSCDVERHGGKAKILCKDLNATVKELIAKNVSLEGISIERQNLDDLFLKLTGSNLD